MSEGECLQFNSKQKIRSTELQAEWFDDSARFSFKDLIEDDKDISNAIKQSKRT